MNLINLVIVLLKENLKQAANMPDILILKQKNTIPANNLVNLLTVKVGKFREKQKDVFVIPKLLMQANLLI